MDTEHDTLQAARRKYDLRLRAAYALRKRLQRSGDVAHGVTPADVEREIERLQEIVDDLAVAPTPTQPESP